MLGFLVENPCRNEQDFLLMISSKLRFALFCKSKLLSLLLLWTEEAHWSFECMVFYSPAWLGTTLPCFMKNDHNCHNSLIVRMVCLMTITTCIIMCLLEWLTNFIWNLILLPQWSLQAEGFQVQICVLSFCAHSGWFTCSWCQVSHCRWCCATNAYITVKNQIQLLVSMVFPSQCSQVQKMAPCSTVLECESYWTQLLVPRLVHIISDQKI